MSKKVYCRSLSSIHILYNQALVGGLSDIPDRARRIVNLFLLGGSRYYVYLYTCTYMYTYTNVDEGYLLNIKKVDYGYLLDIFKSMLGTAGDSRGHKCTRFRPSPAAGLSIIPH